MNRSIINLFLNICLLLSIFALRQVHGSTITDYEILDVVFHSEYSEEDDSTINQPDACTGDSTMINVYTYATFESEVNDVTNELNAEGAPDGAYAEIYNNDETLTLDFGQVYPIGTQYEIIWRRRNNLTSGTAIIDLSESTSAASGYTNHPTSPQNTDNVNFTTTLVSSNVAFRYLKFDKGNSSNTDYEIDAVGVITGTSCALDSDNDGVANVTDLDDDNDGILDVREFICYFTDVEAFWPMENNTDDVSGNGYDAGSGTVAPTFSTDAIEGIYSAYFDGTNTQLRYSVDNDFMESDYTNVSFSCWIKPDNLSGTRVVYEEGGFTNGLTLWLNGNILTYSSRNGGGGSQVDIAHPTSLVVGQWYQIAGTFNNGVLKVYLDGVVASTTAPYSNIPNHSSDGGLGGDFNDNASGFLGNYSGLLDAARYSNVQTWTDADIAQETQTNCDTDQDGIANALDLDSDNDGIADIVEAGGVDSDNDGMVDGFSDGDSDGYADTFDSDNGGTALNDGDQDGDNISNAKDIDSDGDGIIDNIEAQASGTSPIIPLGSDADQDGIDDAFDIDLSGSTLDPVNTDGLGEPDYLDPDADEDGYSDILEAYDTDGDLVQDEFPTNLDNDYDGLDDQYDDVAVVNSSTNVTNNGQNSNDFPNFYDASTSERDWREKFDSDEDGVADFYDLDNDNDGIPNIDEGGCTNPDVTFVGTVDAFWTMENTTDDVSGNNRDANSGTNPPAYSAIAVEGSFSASFNGANHQIRYSSNGDFMESDYTQISFSAWIRPNSFSGNRVIYEEGGGTNGSILWLNGNVLTYSTRDANQQIDVAFPTPLSLDNNWHHVACTFDNGTLSLYFDGTKVTTTAPYTSISAHSSDGGIGGSFGGTSSSGNNGFSGLIDAARYSFTEAWSDARIIQESIKLCDDDNDGIGNQFDLDSDADGISDLLEAGGSDADGNGILDDLTDADKDGFSALVDPDEGGTALSDPDSDGDGQLNRLDQDSDNDGITDNVEGQTTALYVAPSGTDTDQDGIDNSYDPDNGGTAIILSNQDGLGDPDYISLDTDGDGQYDWSEGFDDNNSLDALDDLINRADVFETNAANPLYYINTDDADTDGVPDWLEDDDADNLPNFLDPNSAFYQDTDNDGLVDLYDTDNFGLASNLPDGDSDGLPDFRDPDNQISLPVTLVSFNAEKYGESVKLNWQTSAEINNDFFLLERASDGIHFQPLAKLNGQGNSVERISYQYIDLQPLKGRNYYRLIQQDFDGSIKEEGVRYIYFKGEENAKSRVYPNPSQGESIRIAMAKGYSNPILHLFNSNGKLIYQSQLNIDPDKLSNIILETSNLVPGLYLLMIEDGVKNEEIKLIVK